MKHGDPLIDIMVKRERLLAQCAAQRDDLALLAQQLHGPLQVADRVITGVNYLRRHPLVAGIAVVLFAVIERRNLLQWVQRGFVVWRTYRLFRNSRLRSVL